MNKFLVEKLTISAVGFKKINIDECVCCRGGSVYILYTDDYILDGSDKEELRYIVADIKSVGLDITEEVYIKYFLVFDTNKVDIETYHISHPQLIYQIVSDLVL